MPTPVRLGARVLLGLVVAAVTVLSLRPAGPATPGDWDKVAHAAAYATIACLLVLSAGRRRMSPTRVALLIALAAGYGLAIEVVQHFVGREFDLLDVVANGVGALVGGGVGLVVRRVLIPGRGLPQSRD